MPDFAHPDSRCPKGPSARFPGVLHARGTPMHASRDACARLPIPASPPSPCRPAGYVGLASALDRRMSEGRTEPGPWLATQASFALWEALGALGREMSRQRRLGH